jgi:hypothetical protein
MLLEVCDLFEKPSVQDGHQKVSRGLSLNRNAVVDDVVAVSNGLDVDWNIVFTKQLDEPGRFLPIIIPDVHPGGLSISLRCATYRHSSAPSIPPHRRGYPFVITAFFPNRRGIPSASRKDIDSDRHGVTKSGKPSIIIWRALVSSVLSGCLERRSRDT